MTISKDVLDELLSGVENADDLLGDKGAEGPTDGADAGCGTDQASGL